MQLLILGGSWFLGRTIAVDALARGWEVTAFSRGKSIQLSAGVTHVRGDRRSDADLHRLAESGPWDALIDTSAYEPVDVARVTDVLADQIEQYVLVSTKSCLAGVGVEAHPDDELSLGGNVEKWIDPAPGRVVVGSAGDQPTSSRPAA